MNRKCDTVNCKAQIWSATKCVLSILANCTEMKTGNTPVKTQMQTCKRVHPENESSYIHKYVQKHR